MASDELTAADRATATAAGIVPATDIPHCFYIHFYIIRDGGFFVFKIIPT